MADFFFFFCGNVPSSTVGGELGDFFYVTPSLCFPFIITRGTRLRFPQIFLVIKKKIEDGFIGTLRFEWEWKRVPPTIIGVHILDFFCGFVLSMSPLSIFMYLYGTENNCIPDFYHRIHRTFTLRIFP